MKNHLFLILFFIPLSSFGQVLLLQEFNPVNNWTFTPGSGVANYRGPENYASTNLATYPHNATIANELITITSPTLTLNAATVCGSALTPILETFALSGNIENGVDFLRFQYRATSAGPWVTPAVGATFTGPQNGIYQVSISGTTRQVRFIMETNATC